MISIDAIIEYNKLLTGHGDVLNKNLLESAFSSWHYFETPEEQISSVVRGIIKNHPFRDGNKRTAVLVFFDLMEITRSKSSITDTKLEDIVVTIASSKLEVEDVSKLLFPSLKESLIKFTQFLKEQEASTESFNSFVEEVITTNNINTKSATSFFVDEYEYLKPIFRVQFITKTDYNNYSKEETDNKSLTDYITKLMKPGRIVFFSKSVNGIENLIRYPGLFKLTEDLVGVVYMVKPQSSIDLSKYSGKNPEVLKRIKQTDEILSFEDIKITKIEALYKFEDGWKMTIL